MPRKPADGAKKPTARKPRKPKVETGSVGLTAPEVAEGTVSAPATQLEARIRAAGGAPLATYREPLGGHWVVFASLPLDKVEPTPYQRELSKTHADRLAGVIPKVGRFLDPVIAVLDGGGDKFITPNGMHRLTAMKTLGAKAITALVLPEHEIAFRILALNTEKAHNLRDKALEVVRMVRALAADPAQAKRPETDFALEFESAAFLTIGFCYEKNGRFSGGAYQPVVNRCDALRDQALSKTIPDREAYAAQLLELDEHVSEAVKQLKEAGWTSGYLKPIVVARINPIRFVKPGGDRPDLGKTLAKMIESAKKFDASKVKAADIAIAAASAASGGGEE
jgi:ParB family transcriptional regulator, chromosome partitioning protein